MLLLICAIVLIFDSDKNDGVPPSPVLNNLVSANSHPLPSLSVGQIFIVPNSHYGRRQFYGHSNAKTEQHLKCPILKVN